MAVVVKGTCSRLCEEERRSEKLHHCARLRFICRVFSDAIDHVDRGG